MVELVHKRGWDSKIFDTGRFTIDKRKHKRPIYGTKLQSGLHDIEPNGSFVDVNAKFEDYEVGVSTDKVIRNRCGEVRISDTGSESKDLAKIKTKRECGVSLKLKGIKTYGPFFDDLKSCYYTTDVGIKLRYYPHYKGVSIVVEITNPQTASNIYRFSLKEYGCDYTYKEIGGAIKCVSSTGEDDIWIKATYAVDANGDYGPVSMRLGDVVDGYQEVEKVIHPVWLGNAIAPVLSDPDVTIEDGVDDGVIKDAILLSGASADFNFGGHNTVYIQGGGASIGNNLMRVALSDYSGITITSARFGLDFYIVTVGNVFEWFKVKKTWVEGISTGSGASAGDVTYNSQAHSLDPAWETAGCAGSSDREQTSDGSYTFTGVDPDLPIELSNELVQFWIDNPSSNFGILYAYLSGSTTTVRARSSEATEGNKPYFYMEYTEAAAGGFPFFFQEDY